MKSNLDHMKLDVSLCLRYILFLDVWLFTNIFLLSRKNISFFLVL